ncbi:hypothetical protein O5D80_000782 [Batrachochytrium dendrobatidis]|nr:hypothetical protein O5D80_000782 [Batrachochytrium dendrobatidis]
MNTLADNPLFVGMDDSGDLDASMPWQMETTEQSLDLSGLTIASTLPTVPLSTLEELIDSIDSHLNTKTEDIEHSMSLFKQERSRLLNSISNDILLEAVDSKNALEPVWKLNASIDVLDQLENNSMASMPCLGLSANDWTHFVHQSLDRQVSPAIRAMYEQKVNQVVVDKCHDLIRFSLGLSEDAAILPQDLQTFTAHLDHTLAQINRNRVDILQGYIDILDEYEKVLDNHAYVTHGIQSWIGSFCSQTQPVLHESFASYFETIHSNLRLKLECLKFDLVGSIKDSRVGQDMEKAKHDLEYANRQIQASFDQITAELSQYDSFGDEFHKIVNAYAMYSQELLTIERDLARLDT